MYADVAVCLPLSRTFVYRVEDPVDSDAASSCRSASGKWKDLSLRCASDAPEIEVLPVTAGHRFNAPLLRPEIFELCRWISEYYVSPMGEVLKARLPPGITAEACRTAREAPERLLTGRGRTSPENASPVHAYACHLDRGSVQRV